ncbi:DUF4286 family protein [Chryseobacterium sp.]|uniref:DUF4286 family protein n=1 Tax=Chryseobacterium sp. TaxID=1871047 RepID=UPI0011C835CD|nr:DUF4286 family protein [Chryseobacterium sp.]TXF79381.1 DUF4286 family protein [Chryseobacterium sp.]
MKVLSLTFHSTPNVGKEWENFVQNELIEMAESLQEVKNYLISEVETDMLSEGRNTNLLLIFDNNENRIDFLENDLQNIAGELEVKFGNNVLIFDTLLNPIKSNF